MTKRILVRWLMLLMPLMALVVVTSACDSRAAPSSDDVGPPSQPTPEPSPSRSALETFRQRLVDGAPCSELYELRNALDPNSDTIQHMNEDLRGIGCYSSTSTRTTPTAVEPATRANEQPSFTVREYRIYRALIDTPMSVAENEARQAVARRFSIPTDSVREIASRVEGILFANRWYDSAASEIRHASDWAGENR